MKPGITSLAAWCYPWMRQHGAWIWGARLVFAVLLAAAITLSNPRDALQTLLAIQLAFSGLGSSTLHGNQRYRTWVIGILLSPWLILAVGNTAVIERLGHYYLRADTLAAVFCSLDVLIVALTWPLAIFVASRQRGL